MSQLIDILWREYLWSLYEKQLSPSDINKTDPTHADYDAEYTYAENSLEASWAQAMGFGNSITGDFAKAIGFQNALTSFREIVLGSFAEDETGQTAKSWVDTDLLIRIANGRSNANRATALRMFKSGLIKTDNALLLGDYDHKDPQGDQITPIAGMMRVNAGNLQQYKNGAWVNIGEATIPGTETLTFAASVAINWNGNTTKSLTITAACELTFGTPANYVVRVEITGDSPLTLPASTIKVEGEYEGAMLNMIDLVPTASGVWAFITTEE